MRKVKISHEFDRGRHLHHPAFFELKHPTHGEVIVPLEPRLAGNDIMMLKQASRDGLGIIAFLATSAVRKSAPAS